MNQSSQNRCKKCSYHNTMTLKETELCISTVGTAQKHLAQESGVVVRGSFQRQTKNKKTEQSSRMSKRWRRGCRRPAAQAVPAEGTV